MLDDDLAFAGAARQVESVRRGEVSARELVELALSRIERLDPEINAFGAVYPERALRDAAEANKRVAAGEWAAVVRGAGCVRPSGPRAWSVAPARSPAPARSCLTV